MPTLRDALLPIFPLAARRIPDVLGLRTTTVKVRTRVWSGGEVGSGTPTDSDLEIQPRPHVRDLGSQRLQFWTTPQSAAGGYTVAQLKPDDAPATEYFYALTGPDGVERYYFVEQIDTRRPFRYTVMLGPLGLKVPF